MTDPREKDAHARRQSWGLCPCGVRLGGALTNDGTPLAVFHKKPPCKDFEQRTPEGFVQWVLENRQDVGVSSL